MSEISMFTGGIAQTNGYVLKLPSGTLLVDAPEGVAAWLKRLGVKVDALLLTHQHFDHVLGAAEVVADHGCKVFAWAPLSKSLTLETLFGAVTGTAYAVAEFTVDEVLEGRAEIEVCEERVALFQIPGIAPTGALFAPSASEPIIPGREMLAAMAQPAHIILGWADPKLKAHCDALGITLHEYEWDQDLMLLRGPAIIEGLLKVVIENTSITIHKANVAVVGQGSIGFLLARYMVALGAVTHVAARNPVQRAAAYAAGAQVHLLDELPGLAPSLDMVFSTVPSRVVGRDVLERLPRHALVADLAAPPGGVDFDAAKELGLKTVWARGLGSRAPVTVGASQWSGVRPRIEKILRADA
jgi:dipicolinate synthase subunit A